MRLCDKASKSHSSCGLSGISKSVRWIPKSVSYFLRLEKCLIRTLRLLSKSFWKGFAFKSKARQVTLNFLSIFTSRQQKFCLNVLIWSINLSIIETTGWYLFNDIYLILVYCFVSMLMTSCFVVPTPTLGRKRITYMGPYIVVESRLWQMSFFFGEN